jgi:hypothetical protein
MVTLVYLHHKTTRQFSEGSRPSCMHWLRQEPASQPAVMAESLVCLRHKKTGQISKGSRLSGNALAASTDS